MALLPSLADIVPVGHTCEGRRIAVYCEKPWVHRDDLAKYEADAKRTDRPMLVPFGLKQEVGDAQE